MASRLGSRRLQHTRAARPAGCRACNTTRNTYVQKSGVPHDYNLNNPGSMKCEGRGRTTRRRRRRHRDCVLLTRRARRRQPREEMSSRRPPRRHQGQSSRGLQRRIPASRATVTLGRLWREVMDEEHTSSCLSRDGRESGGGQIRGGIKVRGINQGGCFRKVFNAKPTWGRM